MVLLTSGQVSVAISSFIGEFSVFLFTSALFLSGYVLQQKTVNDIREAIKPQIAPLKPDLYLPPKFRPDEFWDGKEEVVIVNQENKSGQHSHESERYTKEDDRLNDDESMIGATRWQKAMKLKERQRLKEQVEAEKSAKKTAKPKKVTKGKEPEEEPLSAAERRKKIKEEILAAGEGEGFKGYRRRMW